MKKRILRYFKHIGLTALGLFIAVVLILFSENAGIHYGDNVLKMNWENEGPYVFFNDDGTVTANYIHGNQDEGFYVAKSNHNIKSGEKLKSYFNLDGSSFDFELDSVLPTPPVSYDDDQKVLAISDIESGYKTFRDFLIGNKVIDGELNWIFGKGHLVLVGDFVDRGFSTTQVLWFIYKLEQDARKKGGTVHFIIGNHEIKNLQGNFESAAPKYIHIASMLGKQQYEMFTNDAFLGRWLASKNIMERINGNLFVHGGIHPQLPDLNIGLKEINQIARDNYRLPYYPKPNEDAEQFIISTHKGPSWYRGYFKDGLGTQDIENGLSHFNVNSVIVGHTIQSKVNAKFGGKVIGIDVHHPKDYHKNWPKRTSEGVLIEDARYYRVFDDGERMEL